MSVSAFYNRVTRNAWIADGRGRTIARTTIAPDVPMFAGVGEFLTEQDLMRTSDWMLVSDGAPLRQASVTRRDFSLDEEVSQEQMSSPSIGLIMFLSDDLTKNAAANVVHALPHISNARAAEIAEGFAVNDNSALTKWVREYGSWYFIENQFHMEDGIPSLDTLVEGMYIDGEPYDRATNIDTLTSDASDEDQANWLLSRDWITSTTLDDSAVTETLAAVYADIAKTYVNQPNGVSRIARWAAERVCSATMKAFSVAGVNSESREAAHRTVKNVLWNSFTGGSTADITATRLVNLIADAHS